MARHEGKVEVDDAGDLELRCRCGWTRPFGREADPLGFQWAMDEHHQDLRGSHGWHAHIRFGWDDDAPSSHFGRDADTHPSP